MKTTRRCFLATPLALAAAQGASIDERNSDTPGTKTEFILRNYGSLSEWEKRKNELRRQILLAAGLWHMPRRRRVSTRRSAPVRHEGFTTEGLWVETLPGLWVAANLYLPAQRAGRRPAVLIAHGHWKHGRLQNSDDNSTPQLGANLALQGYAALAYDMMGYNETQQIEHHFGKTEEERLWNFGPLGVQLYNSKRMLDFLLSLDDVDPEKVAMTGASGGGTQTFLLAAVDERIKVSVPVNMVSAHFQGGCDCENIPGLRWNTNNVELASLMAPRPQLIVAATGDWTKNVPKVEYPAVEHVYGLYGRETRVQTWQLDAGHNYNKQTREAVYAYLSAQLMGRNDTPKEKDNAVSVETLRLPKDLPVPPGAKSRQEIFADWKQRARSGTKALRPDLRRERLALVLGATWPAEVRAETKGDRIVLSRMGRRDRIPGMLHKGSNGVAALVVHPHGAQVAMGSVEAKSLIQDGATVLAVDAFQTGDAKEGRDRGGAHFLTFNPSDDACRVQDVVTGLAYLRSLKPSKLVLTGLDKAAVWTHLAKSITPFEVSLEQAGTPRTESDLVKGFYAPGVLYAGGGL